jgi:RHS repeat-associated protein
MRTGTFFVSAAFAISAPLALGQSSSSPVDVGLQGYHDYHGGDIDHVNLDNGNLTINIPIVSYPQRGDALKMDFGVVYNGTGRAYQEQCPPAPGYCDWTWLNTNAANESMAITPNGYQLATFGSSTPSLFDLQQISGGEVALTLGNTNPAVHYNEYSWGTADGGSHLAGGIPTGQIALDGSGFQAGWTETTYTTGNSPTITCTWDCTLPSIFSDPKLIATNNGITYMTTNANNEGLVRMDADGNYIAFNYPNFTDTAGRTIPITVLNSSPSPSQTAPCTGPLAIAEIATWTPPGFTQPYIFCYAEISESWEMLILTKTPTHVIDKTTELMLQSIVLPNGQAWTFEYNESISCAGDTTTNVGDVTQVTFPTGGTINYTYECIYPFPYTTSQTTAVTSRTVNANDGTGAHTWNYSYNISSAGIITTVTDPLGNQSTNTLNPAASGSTESRVENSYSGTAASGTLLRSVTSIYPTKYATVSEYPMWPTTVTTTLENGQSTETAYEYCCDVPNLYDPNPVPPVYQTTASYGKVTDTKVYDYATSGLGTLLKETATSYLFQSNSNYMNPGFWDLVSSQTIYNGSGTQMAQTDSYYDQTARVTSGISGLSGAQMTTPLYSVYGHQTEKLAWLNPGSTYATTTNSYYDTGEPYQTTDPMGNTTSTYFCTGSAPTTVPCTASTYLGALPTVVSNALNQQTSFTYRTDTGQKLTVTDPNSQTTTYGYINPTTGVDDYLNRLTSITYPDTGLTSIQYNDTGNIGVTVTEKITSSLNKQSQAIVDGLGRLSETILLSDPSGATYTLNTYDALGRKYQVWNPTRCTPTTTPCSVETTWGITTYNYDAISREILLIPPDGTSTHDNEATSYSGNTTTVTDEAGNYRTTTDDALGRVTQVSEGSAAYLTLYTYDALSNLTCVEQHGGVTGTGCSSPSSDDPTSPWRVRRFTYDSLSRLLTAKNPETGTITYGYNLDSFLTSKTDNRGITITYSPDALNRLTSKTYSDSEPTISYTYDAFTSGTNYGIGRRTGMTDASGSTTWTYDTMGRIWTESQTIATINKSTSDTYNLDGSVATTTYPSGTVLSVTQGGDGRPLSETDTTHSIDYAKSLTYAPPGLTSTALYGYSSSYAGIAQTNTYNSRGQPLELRACGLSSCTDGSGSLTPYLLDLSYGYGLGTNDNGNVLAITNNKNTARSQSFTYDNLNRILTAKEGTAWGVSFTTSTGSPGIDAWGNVFQTSAISGTSINPMGITQVIGDNNQFTVSSYTYDAAGNVLNDGVNIGCGSNGYTWNAEEQMTCAAGATYTYDGDGVRVEKTGGDSTPTLYWGAGTLAESNTSGTLTSEYIYLNGKRIARRDISTGNVYYYFADELGSSSVLATAAGAVENESDYYPFGGESVITQNLTNQHYKFEGKERDPESGLDNFGARFSNSNAGRFMSPDWANKPEPVPYAKLTNPQSLNLYAFAQDNPESTPDLDGHELVKLGQHTDEQIKDRTKEIDKQLKDKSLSKDAKSALKAEKNTLGLEKEGNAAAGNYLKALDSVGERHGLQLSDITLTTDVKHDFSSVNLSDATKKGISSSLTAAFVLGNVSPIYLKTESDFYQGNDSIGFGSPAERDDYGGTILRHEQSHTSGASEHDAYSLQRQIWKKFRNDVSPGVFGRADEKLQKSIETHKDD